MYRLRANDSFDSASNAPPTIEIYENQCLLEQYSSSLEFSIRPVFLCLDRFIIQMIPALLDSDEVSQEEQIRAMRELSQREDDASKLRYLLFVVQKKLSFLHPCLVRDVHEFTFHF